jgi:signal transduction histidine kinase/DNA-binding response OmpR family regulator
MPARWPFGTASTSTIRTRIQWLVVACAVPVALLAAVLLVVSYQRGRDALLQDNLLAARTLVHAVDRELDATVQVLQVLATSSSIDDRDYARFHAQARATLRHMAADNIVLFDTELRGLASAAHEWGTPLPQVRHDRFPEVLRSGRPAVSETFVGQVSKQQQVAVAVPVLRDGRAIARLEMVFGLQRFADLMAKQNFTAQWTAAVLDRGGTIVARSRDAPQFLGKPAAPPLFDLVKAQSEGSFEGPTKDGTVVVASFSRSGTHGWAAAIGVPVQELTAQLRRSLWLFGTGAALLLGAGLLLARKIGQGIAAPIQALVQPALAIGRGEKAAVGASTLHEAHQLGRALQQAQALLSEREQARLKAEAASKQAEELRLLSVRLEAENRQIQEANRLKNEFLANMSHELRTPLNAVIGFAEILRGGEGRLPEAKRAEYINHIAASGRHLLRLINDVLDLSKVESGKFDLVPEPIQLPQVVQDVVSVLQPEASRKGVQVHSQLDPTLAEVVLDPARLKQMLYNLLSNAIKFTDAGGRVWLRASPEGVDRLRIEVEDTGIGIAEHDLPKLFRQFQQVHSGPAKAYPGTGLGLVLTRHLAELHGGSVGVRSTPGQGSVFHLVLPRRISATAREPRPAPPTVVGGDAPTVLVIEDDGADQTHLTQILRTAGYQVELAGTAQRALELANTRRYDAITLDLLLPDRSGLEVLNALRSSGPNREVPVVVITVVTETSALAGFAVSDVLTKPIRPHEVKSALRRVNGTGGGAPSVLVVDDDASTLELMVATLQTLGIAAQVASSATQALEQIAQQAPDAVILDLVMPGMNGFDLLHALRADARWHALPVFVWTSLQLKPDEMATLKASAQAVVAKAGGGLETLVEQLRAWQTQRAQGAAQ